MPTSLMLHTRRINDSAVIGRYFGGSPLDPGLILAVQ